MEQVTSLDGTPIAFHRRGSGTPLILVAGSGAANPVAWSDVIPALAARFTVYAVDRRDRGESGDGPAYALEREAEEQYVFDAARFEGLRTPTLLLLGGDSLPFFKQVAETVAAALPHSRIVVLPGQQHIAMYAAPDLFLQEVLNFLAEP